MNFPDFNLNYWIFQTVAMLLTCWLIPHLRITSIFGALLMVTALAFINANAWDVALYAKVPEGGANQTLVLFLVNGVAFWILVKLLPGIEIDGFRPALIAPIVFTVCSLIVSTFAEDVDWSKTIDWLSNFLSDLKVFVEEHFTSVKDTGKAVSEVATKAIEKQ